MKTTALALLVSVLLLGNAPSALEAAAKLAAAVSGEQYVAGIAEPTAADSRQAIGASSGQAAAADVGNRAPAEIAARALDETAERTPAEIAGRALDEVSQPATAEVAGRDRAQSAGPARVDRGDPAPANSGQAARVDGGYPDRASGAALAAAQVDQAATADGGEADKVDGGPPAAPDGGQAAGAAGTNPVYQQLVEDGVLLPDGRSVKLPEPLLAEGMDAAAQRAALEKLERPGKTLKDMMRATIPAPFVLEISEVPNTRARRVDLYFFAQGELETLLDKDFLENQLGFGAKRGKSKDEFSKSGFLQDEELQARMLSTVESEGVREAYLYNTSNVFDRVLLSTTSHVYQSRHGDSIVAASLLDSRFDGDSQYPNQWRPLVRDASGRLKLGKGVNRYSGIGSYVRVAKVAGHKNLLFIEFHMVFDEPHEWFSGANYISSKLPPLMRDNVQQFRAKLAKARPSTAKQGG